MTTRARGVALGAALAVGCQKAAPADERPPPSRALTADAKPAAASDHIIDETRKCMGTECDIKVWHHDDALVARAVAKAFDELARVEALTTSWRDTSDVSHINAAAGVAPVTVAPDTLEVIHQALWVAKLSDGAFDITVGVFKGLWKFDEDNDGSLPTRAEVERRRKLVNWRDVIVNDHDGTVMLRRKGQRMNLEGLSKGFGVRAAARALRSLGVNDFIVHAGGDLFAGGTKGGTPWKVGIQDPRGPHGRVIFVLPVTDQAFNTSGDYERFTIRDGVRYHHILDARTGYPARLTRSVTILTKDAFLADTLDTAIFAVGPEKGMKIVEDLPDVEAVIIDAKNRVLISSGLKDKLTKVADPTDGI